MFLDPFFVVLVAGTALTAVGYAVIFAAGDGSRSRLEHSPLLFRRDPVCGRTIGLWQVADTSKVCGETLHFCSTGCQNEHGTAAFKSTRG